MKVLRVLTFKREDKLAFVLCIASASAFLIYIIIIIRICHYPSFRSLNWQIGIVVTRHNIVYSTRPSQLSLHCGRVECLNTGKDRPQPVLKPGCDSFTAKLSKTGLNVTFLWENLKKGMTHVTVGVACSIVMSAMHVCLNFQSLSPAMVTSSYIEWKKTQNKQSLKGFQSVWLLIDGWNVDMV